MPYCKICNSNNCKIKEHSFILGKTLNIKEFSGSTPPEIFVGRWNYPNVYTGILSPNEYGDTHLLSSPEAWYEKSLSISDILSQRQKLIYARTSQHIKKQNSKFLSVFHEVAMTHKSIATEFKLKRPIVKNEEQASNSPLISKAGEIESAKLQENAPVKPKIDYLVNDHALKSKDAIVEMDKSNIATSSIIKILSAGLLGIKKNRKLVPTKWSITAVDDVVSKEKLKRIKQYQELSEILVFNAEYVGNHYEFVLLPGIFSFEVIEISMKNLGVWQDYESFFPRKTYADDVTGAYYVNRLALTEYLEKTKRQCQCLVLREVRPEYNVPLGVGILRETSRAAFSKSPEKFNSLQEAFARVQTRLRLPLEKWISKSIILKNYGKQKRLSQFF
ncbi:MAG: hypothetical protein Q8Q31_00750 [Nanoarchaeota archaeon]|nr:hypothetical protein [Nanoarchaeota archaeon]